MTVASLLMGCVTDLPLAKDRETAAASIPTTGAASLIPSSIPSTETPLSEGKNFQTSSSESWKTYEGGLFSIQYPSDWTLEEPEGLVLFKSLLDQNDAFQENVNVLLVPTDQTLEAFIEAALGPSVESSGFELIDSSETTLSGKNARKIIYAEQSADAKLQYLQVISVDAGFATIVTYTATPSTFAEFKDEADAMISSLKLKSEKVA
ncbi:MAG TPA: PsbP-related protein, partial [Candidatus Norongarragalinales archaeon]|nr:PsbP-related protein [Candidatus Norongarragalinales archaeon]